jgi:hypothetical protein
MEIYNKDADGCGYSGNNLSIIYRQFDGNLSMKPYNLLLLKSLLVLF